MKKWKVDKKDMLLYAVTDRKWVRNRKLKDQVEEAILGGATFIQLREKELSFEEFVKEAKEIKQVTDHYKVPFVINDNIQVALEVNADGVHIGQDDESVESVRKMLGPDKIIGVSTHNVGEAKKAQEDGADYIGVGALFPTKTKDVIIPVSYELLKEICHSVEIPVVGIGGIGKTNLLSLSGSGVDGVAVVTAIFAQENIIEATKELYHLSCEMTTGKAGSSV